MMKTLKIGSMMALVMLTARLMAGIADEPDGVAIKLLPDDQFAVTAIATGTYDFDDPDDILDAQKAGTMSAKAALAKFMKEELSTEEGMAEAAKKTKVMTSDGEKTTTEQNSERVKTSFQTISNQASALLKGVIVLEAQKTPGKGTSGTVRVKVGVSSKTLKAVGALTNGIAQAGQPPAAAGASASPVGAAAAGEPAPAAACPEGWTVCAGAGRTRHAAIQSALVEGVAQVFGQSLQSSERLQERSAKLKASVAVDGESHEVAARATERTMETDTLTKTAGFVKAYNVVNVTEKDGVMEATVHAFIVNPRAGGAVAMMVKKPTMTIQDRTTMYDLGPGKRLSGAEVAQEILFALPNGLEKAGKFLVLTDASTAAAQKNAAQTLRMVKNGAADVSELNQLGKQLTPDVLLESELVDIKYVSKTARNKKTKKYEKTYKLSLKLKVKLTNSRTGDLIKSDQIIVSLDNDEIQDLLSLEEDNDLLTAAIAKIGKPLQEMLKDCTFN